MLLDNQRNNADEIKGKKGQAKKNGLVNKRLSVLSLLNDSVTKCERLFTLITSRTAHFDVKGEDKKSSKYLVEDQLKESSLLGFFKY
jgi:hypothetical protein